MVKNQTPPAPQQEQVEVEVLGEDMEGDGVKVEVMDRVNVEVEDGVKTERVPNGGKLLPGSVDVSVLYPSLKTNNCAGIIGDALCGVELEVLSVDYAMVGRTISQMSTPDEIGKMGVRDFCPGRKFNMGPRPGLADTTIKGGDEK